MALVQIEGSVTTSGTGGQFLATSYTVPGGRTLYVSSFCLWINQQPSGVCGLGLSGSNNNANIIALQYDTLRSSFPSGLLKHAVPGGNTLYVFSSGWTTASAVGYVFKGELV